MGSYEKEILNLVINYKTGLDGFLNDYRNYWDSEIGHERSSDNLLREAMWMVDYALVLELVYYIGIDDFVHVETTFGKASAFGTDLLVTICQVLGIDY